MAWNLASKECLASNFLIIFLTSKLTFMSLIMQLLIDLNKGYTKHYLSTHESKCIEAVKTLSCNRSFFIKFFIHSSFVKLRILCFPLTLISHCVLFSRSQSKCGTEIKLHWLSFESVTTTILCYRTVMIEESCLIYVYKLKESSHIELRKES